MSKLLLVFVLAFTAALTSFAECPFKNMSSNNVGIWNQSTNDYYTKHPQPINPVLNLAQPEQHQK